MRTVITGGAGFIGLHLARTLLAAGGEVVIIDNFQRGVRDRDLAAVLNHPQCSLITLDLRSDPIPKIDADAIVHLAAVVGVGNVVNQPYLVLRSNSETLMRILDWGSAMPSLQHLLFTSTSEVYAGSVGLGWAEIPTAEDTPLAIVDPRDPRGTYLLSKVYGEALCAMSGLPYTVVRPHNVYGPRMGMSHVIPQLLHKAWMAKSGTALEVASVDHTRTFLFIDDAIRYLARLLETAGTGQVMNLGNQAPEVTIGELAGVVISTVGKPLSITELPATVGSPARRAPVTIELEAATGMRSEVSLVEGVGRTFDWYRQNVFMTDGTVGA